MSSSNSSSDAVDKHVEHPKLEKLKRLRKNFIWNLGNHRNQFFREFGLLARDWKEQLPNLSEIFTKQEMDRILVKGLKSYKEIVEFVIRSGYKDEPDLDKDGKPILGRTTAVHQIAEYYGKPSKTEKLIRQLFVIYDKFHVNYTDDSGYTHFYIACKYGLDDVAEKFLELGQDPMCLVPHTGDSPLHSALAGRHKKVAESLLKRGADPRLANKNGRTPLHAVCERSSSIADSLMSMLLENVDQLQQTALINAQDKRGDTPLHLALTYGYKGTVQELLRRGADTSLTNAQGQTPLHVVCRERDIRALETLLEDADKLQWTVPIDARDKWGNTPLLLALKTKTYRCDFNAHTARLNDKETMRELLRRGADPSLVDAKGWTALHVICERHENGYLLRPFFEFVDEFGRSTVEIDARNNEGNTPLHLATSCENAEMVELLLKRGADPCAANAKGLTPLLIAARRDVHGSTMKLFFGINEERQWMVGIDARDDEGRTALEWAVTRCWPRTVETLLDRGADVASFVFPTPSDSDRHGEIDNRGGLLRAIGDRLSNFLNRLRGRRNNVLDAPRERVVFVNNDLDAPRNHVLVNNVLDAPRDHVPVNNDEDRRVSKLAAVIGLLAIVELLETRGVYKLDQDAALKIMGFFDKYGLYESNTDVSTSKDVDDLVDTVFQEMAKKPTYMDDFEFVSSYEFEEMIPHRFMKDCCLRLCEKVARKFFLEWALDPFMQLTHHRLPILCCDMIVENITNQDLYNICSAAAGRSS